MEVDRATFNSSGLERERSKLVECELCGIESDKVKRCRCSDCLELSDDGRDLCRECANGIYQ